MHPTHPDPANVYQRLRGLIRDRVWNNSSRVHLDQFARDAAASVSVGARVLDAGAGIAPYRGHFTHTRYETADFHAVEKEYGDTDYVCDLRAIPVPDCTFDGVLLTQVLEHTPDPHRVLSELHRVLVPGGTLWLTAPLFYPEHEQPYDFYRYTQFGFRYQLEAAGFAIRDIRWLEGYAGTVSFQLKEAVLKLPAAPANYGGGVVGLMCAAAVALARVPLFLLASLLSSADVRHRHSTSGHCKNYAIVAEKV